MIKLQQYYIFKISTNRLKRSNYSINLTLNEARKSGEVISIGDSQMLRSLRRLKKQTVDAGEIKDLMQEKKRLKNKKSSKENIQKLSELEKRLDLILFVPEIISISVDDIRQYEHIGKSGFWINHTHYKRLLCGAGQARRNNALFISEYFDKPLKDILNNNRDESLEVVKAKFAAYFSLASSSTLPVSEPYFCVVPDLEIKRTEKVDFIREVEGGDDVVEENVDKEITFNLWDGQGIISPQFAKQWATDLGLDYVPSCFVIRSNFIKGMLAVIDFHKFSEEVAGQRFITDVWGNSVNIRDMDVILTQSQFKLWNAYKSNSEYLNNCRKNELTWGVSKVTPKYENTHTFLNYQFLQALCLDENKIEKICQKTIDYIENVASNKIEYTLLYLLGKKAENTDPDIFKNLHDNVTKALILNNELIEDNYIQSHIIRSLNKKIKESYIGNLLVDGQYTMMVADPYGFLEYLFGMRVKGLLNRGEHYNQYWLSKKKKNIAAMRAPLTWRSEVNILNLKSSNDIKEWYQYLNNCVIYNVFGNDCLLAGGADFDGDIVCVTDNEEVIGGSCGGLPIYYESKKSPKEIIIESELYKSDVRGFNSKVGFVTNCATSAFSMLPYFSEDSPEHKQTINRLKCFRKEQGSTIDAAKGLDIKPFPIHWTKWKNAKGNKESEELEKINFNNRIVINKRPLFMRWVYSSYNKKYDNYNSRYDADCKMRFDISLKDLLTDYRSGNELSEEELKFIGDYFRYTPFIETDCLMNKISLYMESRIKEFKFTLKSDTNEHLISLLKNKEIYTDKEKLKLLYDLYRKYKSEKRNFSKIDESTGLAKYKTIEQFNKYIRQEAYLISNNGSELANLAVDICYVTHPRDNKSFAWNIFGNEIVENIYLNRQSSSSVPFRKDSGNIEYLGQRYEMQDIIVENALEENLEESDNLYYYENIG